MEQEQTLFNAEEAKAFIVNKFTEQGDFTVIEGLDIAAMTDVALEAEQGYMRSAGVLDGGVYDDDEAFDAIRGALDTAFPEFKMYCMRFAEDYLDYSEAYLESAGLIEWE